MKKKQMLSNLRNQRGVSAIVVAISIFMLIGFAALAIDLGHLYVVKNELQNAADAGALAGAQALYGATKGAAVDPNANPIAYAAATANSSDNVSVELYNHTANSCLDVDINDDTYEDVQRGHWAFASSDPDYRVDKSGFDCNNSLVALNIADYSAAQLNADKNHINAVKVVTRRKATPIVSFFARIFGHENFQMSAEAVGYIHFASLDTLVGEPIAICEDTITDIDPDTGEKKISCNIGRMFNANEDTARWTNLMDPDEDSADANDVKALVSCDQNTEELILTEPEIATMEGQVDVAFQILHDCWKIGSNEIVTNLKDDKDNMITQDVSIDFIDPDENIPDQPWAMTLPVIECNHSPTWGPVKSAVYVQIIWIARFDDVEEAPQKMYYDIPTFDEYGNGPNYSTSWPDSNGFWTTSEGPQKEYINLPNDYSPDDPTSEPSVYDIMKTFPDFDNIDKEIQKNPDWGNPDGWEESYPYWATKMVEELFDDYGAVRWASLVKHFNLRDKDGGWADYEMKTIYFKPTCEKVESTGHNGDKNFGILAKYPALVK